MCGQYGCSDRDLLRAFYATRLVLNDTTGGMLNIQLLFLHRRRYLERCDIPLQDLLVEIGKHEYYCKDPRDHIYSLLSL
jgi:hypothetical protein